MSDEAKVRDLAMMLRRFIWQIERQDGDTSLKVLAGNARELLAKYQLEGNILRGLPHTDVPLA